METITWKNSDLSGRTFELEIGNQLLGTLTRMSALSSNANYVTEKDRIQFQRVGFLENRVLLNRNGELIGEIGNRLIGQTFLKLKNGNTYRLSSNSIGRNLKWIDTNGKAVVEYAFATRASMRKGSIKTDDSIDVNEKDILISAGLIAGWFNAYRLAIKFLYMAFVFYLIIKLIE